MASKNTPDRLELFSFYYLGFDPEGNYRFANAHRVARHYQVSADAVLQWLKEMDLEPKRFLDRQYDLAEAQVELQLSAGSITPEFVRQRAGEILEEIDQAPGGRDFWSEDSD